MGGFEQLARNLRGRKIEVFVNQAVEDRLRMFIDRVNASGVFDDEKFNPDSDEDIEFAILACVETGLEADERQHGLTSSVMGEVMSTEVMEEGVRRRRAAREAQREGNETMGVTPEIGQDIRTMHPRELLRGLMRGNKAKLQLGYSWDNAVLATAGRRDVTGEDHNKLRAYAQGFRDGMLDDARFADQEDHRDDYLEGYEHGAAEDKSKIYPAQS